MNWELEKLFSNDKQAVEHAQKHLRQLENLIQEFENTFDEEKLIKLLKDIEENADEFSKTNQYAWMKYSVNTNKLESQKLLGIVYDLSTKTEEMLVRMKLRLSQLNDEKIISLKNKAENYKHLLDIIERKKPHMLHKEAEKVLALMSGSRRGAISKIHSRLESSYVFELEIEGERKRLTTEEVKSLRRCPDSKLRKHAMKMLLNRFANDSIVLTEIYNLIVKDYDTESKLREFKRPICMMNIENEVEDEIVDNLINVTNENVHIVRNYYKWKSGVLGEELTLADLYAPLSSNVRKFTFQEAKDIILNAYYLFDECLGKIVKSFFDENRIDLYPKEGKVSGAYCIYSTTKFPAYILTNFNGDMYDIMTLAHELGHGVHGTLSKKQTFFNYDTPLTLSELASVFGEFLVFEYLKENIENEEKIQLMASKIEDTFATTFRQNMFTNFEIKAHDLIGSTGFADWNELNEIYYNVLLDTFGDVVNIPEWYKNEWAMVSHFFETPFYVYAYNFAHCLVISLYQKYLESGKLFSRSYKSLLESGGSLSPKQLLNKVGIDISKSSFWEDSFKFINYLSGQLYALKQKIY
ncbi:MAG: M3 family oligoendopeptidase [Fervidobacterium sp.]